jgi:hypothetical protein
MSEEIRAISPDRAWDDVVRRDGGQVFASSGYLELIRAELGGPRPRHLGAYRDGELVGVLPSLTACVDGVGCVNNSSPYYGSHGGVYTTLAGPERDACVAALLRRRLELCEQDGCATSNLVEPLGNRDAATYEATLRPWRTDERTGQVLEDIGAGEAEMMDRYHSKTRNMVRKAQRQAYALHEDRGALGFLAEVHAENMAAIGLAAKSPAFFRSLPEHLGEDWTVHVAALDGEPVAALLVLYFGDCAEYYTPVTRAEHRAGQPMSLLVHRAILTAAERGLRRFNFGGTGRGQEGVYRFKARFGATDRAYRYYVSRHDGAPVPPPEAVAAFRGFYLYPLESRA